jgi:hypothetical protein
VIVEQTEAQVETFRYSDRRWLPATYESLDAAVTLECIHITIPMREIYRKVFA